MATISKTVSNFTLTPIMLQLCSDPNYEGLALGNEQFTLQIERLSNRRVTPRKAGRPKKIPVVDK